MDSALNNSGAIVVKAKDGSELEQHFELGNSQAGIFIEGQRVTEVGKQARIQLSISALEAPIYLEGIVTWRRVLSGGPKMPIGFYISLVDRDRLRLHGLIRYLGSEAQSKDRRRAPRFPLFASSTYGTASGEFPSELSNISATGAFIRCLGPLLPVGSTIPVVLKLDGDHQKGVELNTTVAWLDMFDSTKGMGLAFEKGQPTLKRVERTIGRIRDDLRHLSR